MASTPIEIRAPQGAVGWTPTTGYVYDTRELPDHVDAGHYVIVVSESDGMVRLNSVESAPLAAVLRLETDVAELVARVADIDHGVDDQAIEAVSDLRMAMVDFFEFASARLSQGREIMWGDRPPNDG